MAGRIVPTNLEKALTAAGKIQLATLPREQPNFPGFDIHGEMKSYYKIGGDFYDFLPIDNGKLGLAIADVSDKGIEAALVSLSMHASLHAYSHTNSSRAVSNVMYQLNNFLFEHTIPGRFATLIYGELGRDGNLEYCSAGHEAPLLHTNGKTIIFDNWRRGVKKANLPIGAFPNIEYDTFNLELQKGDVFLMYSDGVPDSINERTFGEAGLDSLVNILEKNHLKSAKDISNEVYKVLDEHRKIDDQTLLIVKRTE